MRARLLAAAAVLAALVLPAVASAGCKELKPGVDYSEFLAYRVPGTGNWSVEPQVFKVEYVARDTVSLRSWWCLRADLDRYRYRVTGKYWETAGGQLPSMIEFSGGRILLSYYGSFTVAPYATRAWYLIRCHEAAVVFFTMDIYARWVEPPTRPMTVDLGRLLADRLGTDRLQVHVHADIQRVSPEEANLTLDKYYCLSLTSIPELSVFTVNISWISVSVSGWERLEPLGAVPRVTLHTHLCLGAPPEYGGVLSSLYRLSGRLVYRGFYGSAYTDVVLEPGKCVEAALEAPIPPGSYTGNRSLVLHLLSSTVAVPLSYPVDVPGAMLQTARPYAVASYNGSWTVTVYVPYTGAAHASSPLHLRVQADWAEFNGEKYRLRMVSWREGDTSRRGVAVAVYRAEGSPPPPSRLQSPPTVYVTVSIPGPGFSARYTVEAAVAAPVSATGLAVTLYKYLLLLLLAVSAATLLLSALSSMHPYLSALAERFAGAGVDAAALALVLAAVPVAYRAFYSLLLGVPELSQYLAEAGLTGVGQLSTPDQALATLMQGYDRLYEAVIADYYAYFTRPYITGVLSRVAVAGAAAGLAVAAALGSVATGGGGSAIAGVVLAVLSTVFATLSMATSMYVAGNIVLVVAALARALVTLTGALALAAAVAGVALRLAPSHRLSALSDELLALAVTWLIAVPLAGPLLPALYLYARDTGLRAVSEGLPELGTPQLSLPGGPAAELLLPLHTLATMTVYAATAAMAAALAVAAAVTPLARPGPLAGLAEAIIQAARK